MCSLNHVVKRFFSIIWNENLIFTNPVKDSILLIHYNQYDRLRNNIVYRIGEVSCDEQILEEIDIFGENNDFYFSWS